MMRRVLASLILVAAAIAVEAQTFQEYLKLRKQHGITQAVGIPALETFIGKRILEVKGLVKGTIATRGRTVIILDRGDGASIYVQTEEAPDWLHGNEVAARLIVKAERDTELGELRTWLLGAAPEADVAAVEAKEAAKRPHPAKPKSTASRDARKPSAPQWNLPANEATYVYADAIRKINKRLSDAEALKIATGIVGYSIMYGVDARLIMAMVFAESGFNPSATSRAGAMGLGQLMPGTARGMGVTNAYDSIQNLYATVRLVRGHLDKYGKSAGQGFEALVLALAAYNSGSGTVRRYGGVPPYRETQNYIRKVIGLYQAFKGG